MHTATTANSVDPEAFLAELKRVRSQLCNSTNAIALYAGSAKGAAANRPLADALLAGLNHEEIIPVNYDSLPAAARREALIVDSAVQYNMIQAGEKELGTPYSADMDALASLVSDMYLYPKLRDQYGAYSVMHGAGEHLGMYVLSYRDPNVTETFAVYDKIPEFLQGETEQETLDGYILSSYSRYALSQGELSGALNAIAYGGSSLASGMIGVLSDTWGWGATVASWLTAMLTACVASWLCRRLNIREVEP